MFVVGCHARAMTLNASYLCQHRQRGMYVVMMVWSLACQMCTLPSVPEVARYAPLGDHARSVMFPV